VVLPTERCRVVLRAVCSPWACLVAFVVALVLAAVNGAERINPDAVSYIRIAEYWRDGDWTLAINGYWGPLVSWLIAPLLAWIDRPLVACRIAMGFGAIVYFVSALRLMRVCGLSEKLVSAAAWVFFCFCLKWSVEVITPDLLMSGLMILGISIAVRSDRQRTKGTAFVAGAIYGMAYLAKAVALPIALMLAVLLPVLRRVERSATTREVYRDACMTLCGLTIVALPWIAVLSSHYGAPTFSTSGAIAHAIVGPAGYTHPSFETFHTPEAGRVTSWEDPSRMNYLHWSPFASTEALSRQLKVVNRNVYTISNQLKSLDLFGCGPVCALGALLLAMLRLRVKKTPSWWMALPILASLTVLYLPVYAEEPRYYLACYAFMLAAALGLLDALGDAASTGSHAGVSGTGLSLVHKVATIAVLVSFIAPYLGDTLLSISGTTRDESLLAAENLRDALAKYGKTVDGVATIGETGAVAFYLSYLEKKPFCGGGNVASGLNALFATPANLILVALDQTSSPAIARDPRFHLLPLVTDRTKMPTGIAGYAVYEILGTRR
jgi:hypothetical protein